MIVLPFIPIILFLNLSMVQIIVCGECNRDAITSFDDCVNFCRNKYGIDEEKQRQFYNQTTGNCEKKVKCEDTLHRYYENRCLGPY